LNNQNWWQGITPARHDPNESSTWEDTKFGLTLVGLPLLAVASLVALIVGLARLFN
jgi:hypothetical protein